MSDKIGLAVMRLQPLHKGHVKVINHMIQDCKIAIVCIGSAQISREKHDPWTIEERMEMLKRVYGAYDNKGNYLGCRIKILPLNDLGAAHPDEWVGYIFDKIAKIGLPQPTEYYTGSEADAQWYKYHFWSELFGPNKLNSHGNRILHVIERNENPMPAATEIRTWLETRSDGWKTWVPIVNHDLVEATYPEEFKVPLA